MIFCHMKEIIKNSPYKRENIIKYLKNAPNTLNNWCNGHSFPTADKLFKLAYLLVVEVRNFYEYKEDKN